MFEYEQYKEYPLEEIPLRLTQTLKSQSNLNMVLNVSSDIDPFLTAYGSKRNIVMFFDDFDLHCLEICQFINLLLRHENIRVVVTTRMSQPYHHRFKFSIF